MEDVPYGNFDTNAVQYYFDAGNGFSAVVSLEEGSGGLCARPRRHSASASSNRFA
ncbi:hypothetical protein X740_14255 [Mesorhizobium sp. LNHC221B00]|nr:hypothetical protein X740_14255 [Mesorhizobium sp. LNHC221B00]